MARAIEASLRVFEVGVECRDYNRGGRRGALPIGVTQWAMHMANRKALAFVKLFLLLVTGACSSSNRADYAIVPVPYSQVDITDAFWSPKIEVNRSVSIQHIFRKYEEHGRFDSPRVIEAAAYMLAKRRDPELERYVDDLIDKAVAGVDGRVTDPDRVVRVSGNLLEAGVAYYEATGKRKLLDAAIKAANAMDAAYGPGKKTYISGHEGLKIGLLSLYRETQRRSVLEAREVLPRRARQGRLPATGRDAADRTYAQDQAPVVAQNEAIGHAVRATYLYIPLTDIAALTGAPQYAQAVDRIWEDAAYRKTYVTGAIGSIRFHEQFGAPYELPNLSAWNETCASYGYILWNQRMFLLHHDARYLDLLERDPLQRVPRRRLAAGRSLLLPEPAHLVRQLRALRLDQHAVLPAERRPPDRLARQLHLLANRGQRHDFRQPLRRQHRPDPARHQPGHDQAGHALSVGRPRTHVGRSGEELAFRRERSHPWLDRRHRDAGLPLQIRGSR